jgi:hypothetical protein
MPQVWTISVNGQIYGPYGASDMRKFAAEGRLSAQSLIAREGESLYLPAERDEDLAPLFRTKPAPARPTFFTADGDAGRGFGRAETDESSESSHFIIVADMKSRSISGLEEEIFRLGHACQLTPQSWVLSSNQPINAVRSALVQKLGKIDVLFIVDASNDKSAWFNYGPEAESRIRRIWQKTQEQARA